MPTRSRRGAFVVPGTGRAILAASILSLLLLLVAFAAGCSDSQTTTTMPPEATAADADTADADAAAPEVTDIDLVMDWVPWVLDIPIDVAQDQGFYAEVGLTVTQTVPTGPTDVVKFVSTGRSQFGLYYAPDVLMARAEGAPVISVAALMGHAPLGLAMKPGFEAVAPSDLVGKTVAVPMIPSVRASYESLLVAGDVDPESVTLVDPGFNLVAPLLAGTYDAVAFTAFGELVEAGLGTGSTLAYLDFRDWGSPDYAFMNIVTSEQFAAENPNTVRAFVAATLKGLEYAAANPQEAADIYHGAHPELDRNVLLAQWEAATPSLATSAGAAASGAQDEAAWKLLHDWMVETGLLGAPQEAEAAVTNEYLPR